MDFRFIFLFLTLLLFVPVQAMACECMALTEEQAVASNQELLSESVMAAHVRVLEHEFPNWSTTGADRDLKAKIELLDVYKGKYKQGDILEVKSSLKDNCGRVLQEDDLKDLLVFENEQGLYLKNICTDLSQKGWAALKADKKAEIRPLSYEEYHAFASGLDHKKKTVNLDRFLELKDQDNTVILDLREKEAYDKGHIEGALHLGADITKERLEALVPSKETKILLYCWNSLRLTRMFALTDVTFPQIRALGYEDLYKLENYSEALGQDENAIDVYNERLRSAFPSLDLPR